MKVVLALLPFVAAVLAQSSSAAAPAVPSQTPTAQQTCLAKCAATDLNCKAACVGVPNPDNNAMNQVTDCVAKCDQGDGSAAATEKYGKCRNDCINQYILTTGTAGAAAATATTSGAAASGSSKASAASGSASSAASSASSSRSGSASSAAASASSSGGAAPTGARMAATGGSLGLVLAAFAML